MGEGVVRGSVCVWVGVGGGGGGGGGGGAARPDEIEMTGLYEVRRHTG